MTDRERLLPRRTLLGLALLGAANPGAAMACEGNPEMATQEILRVVSAYADAWRRGDMAAIAASYHEDFMLHYSGAHALSGVHAGKAEALRVLAEVSRRTRRRLVEIVSVMAGPTRGAILARERWQRAGEEAMLERVLVYSVRDGKLAHCWLYDTDQALVARFLSEAE